MPNRPSTTMLAVLAVGGACAMVAVALVAILGPSGHNPAPEPRRAYGPKSTYQLNRHDGIASVAVENPSRAPTRQEIAAACPKFKLAGGEEVQRAPRAAGGVIVIVHCQP